MRTYVNNRTGLVLTVDGPVIVLVEGKQSIKMSFGEAAYAEGLAERMAQELRAVQVNGFGLEVRA